jgi:hypothetical protein
MGSTFNSSATLVLPTKPLPKVAYCKLRASNAGMHLRFLGIDTRVGLIATFAIYDVIERLPYVPARQFENTPPEWLIDKPWNI